jgi:protein-S-isoprenylcysteine O-methyltransferase Ste14
MRSGWVGLRGRAQSLAQNLGRRLYPYRGWVMGLAAFWLVFARAFSDTGLQPWGLVGVAVGIALRAWAGLHIGEHTNGHVAEAPTLCVTGPYAHMRHPLYVSNCTIAAGLLVFAQALPWDWSFVLWLGIVLFYATLGAYEESVLIQRFGEDHTRYRNHVGLLRARSPMARLDDPATSVSGLWLRQARNVGYALGLVLLVAILARAAET